MRSVPLLCLAAMVFLGCSRGGESQVTATSGSAATAENIREFCSACHLFPAPDILPRSAWRERIDEMYEIARGDTRVAAESFPPPEEVVEFYTRAAPESLPSIDSTARRGPGSADFARHPLRMPALGEYPGVANVRFARLAPDGRLDLLVCDMRHGSVLLMRPDPATKLSGAYLLGSVPHPCRAEPADLDGDGFVDLLVANLGTVTPSDAENGSVEWLRGDGTLRFRKVTLASGLGRVADVRAADFDGDGDRDLVVAVFGWRKVGEILYLENRTESSGKPEFVPRVIDGRPGAIHVPVTDLNGDGLPDFVALIAQHYETVVAFVNLGDGVFEQRPLFAASHPNWGSSGIDLVDFDGDGDLDVLFANGDTLDDRVVKPYHGLQWLENRGSFPFAYHRLTDLYGAHFAKAGDIDGDGDTDLVASTFLPFVRATTPQVDLIESIVWLEQTAPGRFERHPLETATPYHPTLDLADFDGDGDLDVVVGNMTMAKRKDDTIDHLALLLENRRK